MDVNPLTELALIVGLGIAAQWIAWRVRMPSILFLLAAGVVAGPFLDILHPDEVFGGALMSIVSIAVALILFEGGLTLKFAEIPNMGRVVWMLVTVGAVITWAALTFAAWFFLEMPLAQSWLLGAVLVVTGPTVIGPLLRHIRPVASVGSILKWEGILIDPVGAVLAVLVYECLSEGIMHESSAYGLQLFLIIFGLGVVKTLAIGLVLGGGAAWLLILLLKRYWLPDFLQNPATLAMVVMAFAASNNIQHESGLLTVTVMGVIMGNQKNVPMRHVIEFKENLRVLLISVLFVMLAARLQYEEITQLTFGAAAFIAFAVIVARPLSVWVSTLGSELSWQERALIAWMAPRGIVAAAIASIFALRLESNPEFAGAPSLVPITFMLVTATVLLYGLTAAQLARFLGVAQAPATGLLLIGAHPISRTMAKILVSHGVNVKLVDTNWSNIRQARLEKLNATYTNALSEHDLENLNLDGLGQILALTSNDQVNTLAVLHFAEYFDSNTRFQLAPEADAMNREGDRPPANLRGRTLFGKDLTYKRLAQLFETGATIEERKVEGEADEKNRVPHPGQIPLFLISGADKIHVYNPESKFTLKSGDRIIYLNCMLEEQKSQN